MKKFLTGVLAVGVVTGFGIGAVNNNLGTEIYRGNIDGQEVVYKEGIYDFRQDPFSTRNVMILKKGDITCTLEDRKDRTYIDWRNETKPSFESDKLDRVSCVLADKIERYGGYDPNPDTKTLNGKHEKKVLDSLNIKYNDFRAQIREGLRNEYQKQSLLIEEKLK